MQNDIKTVKAITDFKLDVELCDGRKGIFDLEPYLHHAGMFALRDPNYFEQVISLYGAATWPNGEDIAPETLAAGLRAAQPA